MAFAPRANPTIYNPPMPRHAVFSMGIIKRAVACIFGLDHVRETISFARTLNRVYSQLNG
jgi:aspartyl/asparaginyl-tRNA synthetase